MTKITKNAQLTLRNINDAYHSGWGRLKNYHIRHTVTTKDKTYARGIKWLRLAYGKSA